MPEPESGEQFESAEAVAAVETADEAVQPEAETSAADAPSVPVVADAVLLNAESVAREALLEITAADTIGKVAGHIVEGERVLSLLFENTLRGYVGWFWTVSLSREEGSDEVNVLETELTPGDDALLAPDWVPWSQRMAEYQAQQKALRDAAAAAGEELPDDEFALAHADDEDEHYADDELEEHELEEDELIDELEEIDEIDELDDTDDDDDDDFDESDDIQGAEEAALDEEDDDEDDEADDEDEDDREL